MKLAYRLPAEALDHRLDTIRDRIFEDATRKVARAQDDEVRRMLGEWVSELEPSLVYGPGGELLGLGPAGTHTITIRARPIELSFRY